MKKIYLFSLLIFFSLPINAQQKRLKLSSDIWPPFTDIKNNTAFAIDLVKLALSRSGIGIENEITEFDQVLEGIKNSEIDGSAALWKDKEREQFLSFSEPYLQNQLILVGRKGSEINYKSLGELKGKKIGIVGDYAYGLSTVESEQVDWVPGTNDQKNLQRLLKNEVDYILVDALLIQYLLNSKREEALQHLEIGKNIMIKRPLHFAIRKDLPDADDIIKRFNTEIIRMIADGSYNRVLHLNWIKADIDGDGAVEMVLEGNKAGNTPPVNTYSVLLTQQNEITPGQKTKYYVGGNFYQSWEKIPKEYKVPKMKDEDLSKIGLIDFRF